MATWQEQVEALPLETRIKARLSYELAADRAAGQPVDIARSALRAVADAEGIDSRHPWVDAAAIEIAGHPGRPASAHR